MEIKVHIVINILKLFVLTILFSIAKSTMASNGGVVSFSGMVVNDSCNASGDTTSLKLTCYEGSDPVVNNTRMASDVNKIADSDITSESSVRYINKEKHIAMLNVKYN